jgi:hypothetical protein
MTITPLGAALLGVAIGLSACSEGVPRVVQATQVESPSRNVAATVEVVDNGLGFGQGALYDEIHLGPSRHGSFAHGDKDESVIYYAESTYEAGLDRVQDFCRRKPRASTPGTFT